MEIKASWIFLLLINQIQVNKTNQEIAQKRLNKKIIK
jgi:hypothetical protein